MKVEEAKIAAATAAAKSLQLCPILCDPIDGSPPGSPIPGILQARTLEWVAISFSNVWKWKVKVKSLSRVRLLATPWTAAHQVPPSMGFSRQEYWSGVPLPSPSSSTTQTHLGLGPWAFSSVYISLFSYFETHFDSYVVKKKKLHLMIFLSMRAHTHTHTPRQSPPNTMHFDVFFSLF